MGLRIWETDPDAAPKPRRQFADVVGRFRSGYQVNNRPVALQAWRVTTGDPHVAEVVAGLLGSENGAETWDTSGEDNLEIFTDADSVDIIIDAPAALRSEMVLWGRAGAIRRCDGVTQHGEGGEGKSCECPMDFNGRKDAAKTGRGCAPSITLFFTLADEPDLGRFKFVTGSWSMVRDLGAIEEALAAIDGPALARLRLEVVDYESEGRKKSFTKPVIEVLGPADA